MIFPKEFESKIGFDLIRHRLQDFCQSSLGMKRVNEMRFSSNFVFVKKLLEQTVEYQRIQQSGTPFPASHFFDPTDLFPTIAIEESFIEEEPLREIVLSLQAILDCKEYLNKAVELYPQLSQMSAQLTLSPAMVKMLASKFDDAGKIRDNASPELARIRKQLKDEEGKVRRLTDQLFRQAVRQGWVPEGASPTIREGRVVIPILAEHKRKMKGFIMDESATGQTIYMEPSEVLEANNEIRDLMHAERRELIRILRELTTQLRLNLPDVQQAFSFLATLDFIRAKVKFATEIDATLPQLKEHSDLNWMQARHPLLHLTLQKLNKKVVPLDIDLTSENPFLLVSGPNAGGKSVCLKTVGLIQYMVQCGLLAPLDERSTVGIFERIFLDIGDQQSMENDLSTYSSHLRNMSYFLSHAQGRSLVLMDELGSGTDPNFGGGIAEAILATLIEKKVWGIATTHYYNLKLFAESTKGIRNGSMQFDTKNLEPLFCLELGKPGSSFALEIARKTGLPRQTIDRAEQIIGKELIGLESLMKNVAQDKLSLEKRQREIQQKEKELSQALTRYESLADELETKKKEIINKAKTEASYLLKETNREIEKTIRHIQENKANKQETRKVRTGLQELAKKVEPAQPVVVATTPIVLKVGDKVRMIGQEVTGTILSIKGNSVVVQFGIIQSHLKLNQLVRSDLAEPSATKSKRTFGVDLMSKQSTFVPSLDIRGKRVEEVAPLLEEFLDNAILLSQAELKILHGKGEGVLRKVVREQLKKVKAVASVKDEHVDRGGDGITVVVLK
ncbi:MAG: endonuclease MutS2 [Cyclobacteriaceae bacterium]|nr:endonuclease MutS2 [Cyclobacteriaceae bacterium]